MRNTSISLLFILHCFLSVLSEEITYQAINELSPLQRPRKLTTLNDLNNWLELNKDQYGKYLNLNKLDLYLSASTNIKLAHLIFEKKPRSEEARAQFQACSLLTEAAVQQLISHFNDLKISILYHEINSVLKEINQTQEKINHLEQTKTNRLQVALDEEKVKAEKIRKEAEKKFAELQNSFIQVRNDARGTIISMSDILFEVNKAKLTSELKTSLAKIAGILMVFKNSHVIIEGHTDNQGSAQYNQILSEKRAQNVMTYLISQDIAPSRLSALGLGLSKPIADNTTKEGRQKNRRVDLIIQENE